MTSPHYSTAARRSYIKSRLHVYKPRQKGGYSYRDIAFDVKEHFELEKPPSPATIKNDLHVIEEGDGIVEITDEALELLKPENFAEWRAKFFVAPGTNEPYETPEHQLAWFWLVISLALKVPLPLWVIDWFNNFSAGFDKLDINDWCDNPEKLLSLMLLAPPRHGKTDLFAHTLVWLICKNPNVRLIWCGGVKDVSKLTVQWVKEELEQNEELISMYGPFESDNSWSNTEFTVATRTVRSRSATLTAVGKGSTVLSRDADLIILDDFVDLRASLSPTTIETDVLWVRSQLMTRREPWTPLLGIGSHQPSPYGDAYDFMAQDQNTNMVFIEIKAHDYEKCLSQEDRAEKDRHGEWCLLWESLRPWWFLEDMRRDLGDIVYEVCYNQDAAASKIQYFSPDVLRGEYITPEFDETGQKYADPDLTERSPGCMDYRRTWGTVPRCCGNHDVLVVIGFDPAASEKKGSSESALSVRGACPVCHRRYRIDYWKERVSPEKHPGVILRFVEKYKPLRLRVEVNAYQKALSKNQELVHAQATHGFIIDEWNTDEKKWDVDMGIPLLSRFQVTGKESWPAFTPDDRIKTEEIIRQYLRWPQRPNDMVMADWLADLSLQGLIEELAFAVPEYLTDPEDIPPYLLEGEIVIDVGALVPVDSAWWE